jgi:hypothetical protein
LVGYKKPLAVCSRLYLVDKSSTQSWIFFEMPFHDKTRRLHRIARKQTATVDYSRHALEEMSLDAISRNDVETLLRRSAVTDVQPDDRWRVSGKDQNERNLEVIVCVEEDELLIDVITAWDRKLGRSSSRRRNT